MNHINKRYNIITCKKKFCGKHDIPFKNLIPIFHVDGLPGKYCGDAGEY